MSNSRMDAAYSLLGSVARRQLLYRLQQEDCVSVDDLAAQLAQDQSDDASELSANKQKAYISLVHNHLPRLADHDVIEYDLRSGDVVLSSGFTELEALLEQFSETEDIKTPTKTSS